MLKIWKVTFNDGGWHTSLPSFHIIAETGEQAEKKAVEENKTYATWDVWSSELKIPGYVIEVWDEKTYNREKKLDNLI